MGVAGRTRGRAQRGHTPTYDPTAGRPYRPDPTFLPDNALKLIRMATSQGTSVAEVVNELVRRAEITPDGRPAWAVFTDDEQTQLIA